MMLILVFACYFKLLPSLGYLSPFSNFSSGLKHLILPSLALGMAMAGSVTRYTRSGMLEELGKDYLNTARAKGLPERLVIYKHGFRNALIQVVTIVGLYFGWLLGGSIVVEQVFAWPGIGQLIVDAIFSRDYQMVQALVLFIALIFILINIIVDLVYCLIDPRIRFK
jgi:ABC-type dipeptide/oligopeptide/nickel transport system permease component